MADTPDFTKGSSGPADPYSIGGDLSYLAQASATAASAATITGAGGSGSLAARGTVTDYLNRFYYATDQVVLYFSDGSNWYRMGEPAGATTHWYGNTSVPTGWVAYDGGTLGGSTGIYADLYSHLGSTTTLPNTKGRLIVIKGTNADVSTIGNSDGLAEANRSPKHNSTNNTTISNHKHEAADASYGAGAFNIITANVSVQSGAGATGFSAGRDMDTIDTSNPTSLPATGGSIGPGGSRPTDTPAYIVFGLLIAKL